MAKSHHGRRVSSGVWPDIVRNPAKPDKLELVTTAGEPRFAAQPARESTPDRRHPSRVHSHGGRVSGQGYGRGGEGRWCRPRPSCGLRRYPIARWTLRGRPGGRDQAFNQRVAPLARRRVVRDRRALRFRQRARPLFSCDEVAVGPPSCCGHGRSVVSVPLTGCNVSTHEWSRVTAARGGRSPLESTCRKLFVCPCSSNETSSII